MQSGSIISRRETALVWNFDNIHGNLACTDKIVHNYSLSVNNVVFCQNSFLIVDQDGHRNIIYKPLGA